jgi:antitoxin VapB
MIETKVAKLFKNGASQAVRLPAEFRFEGTEVYASRDEETGDVTLSTRPGAAAWAEFFRSRPAPGEEKDYAEFMNERPMNALPIEKNLFGIEDES